MNEIPAIWFWLSGAFYAFGIIMFLVIAFLCVKVIGFLKNVQPSITNVAAKIETVTTTVNNLSHKVEGITGKVEGIADTVRGIADSAKDVADSAKGTVRSVGNKTQELVSNLSTRAEETLMHAKGSQVVNALMMGMQVYNAVQHMRQHKNGQVDNKGEPQGNIDEHRGVEQSGSSSGS